MISLWQAVIIIAWYCEAWFLVWSVRRYLADRKRTTTGWARYRESRPVNLHGFIVHREPSREDKNHAPR